MSAIARLLLSAIVAYVVIGLIYATGETIISTSLAGWPLLIPVPWSSASSFVDWFVPRAVQWPWFLVGRHHVPEILVSFVYLATVGLFYLAASRRSAPRRLKSTYPDNH